MQTNVPWVDLAATFLGVKEIPGPKNNPQILEFLKGISSNEDTPWCAAFVNYVMTHSGYKGSGSAMARSFEKSSNFTHTNNYTPGAIVTRYRGDKAAGLGHVGFAVGRKPGFVAFLGGNQGDKVSVSWQPEEFITGYHWPVGANSVKPMSPSASTNFVAMADGSTKMV